MMLEDRESASVSSMEIVTQVVDQREKIRPAGWSCCWSERKFALYVQNGQIVPILCVLGEFYTGGWPDGVLLGEFCTGWGPGGVLLGEFCTGWGLGVRVRCVEWCQVREKIRPACPKWPNCADFVCVG